MIVGWDYPEALLVFPHSPSDKDSDIYCACFARLNPRTTKSNTQQHQHLRCFQRKEELIMSEAEEYEVETIVSKRLRKGKLIIHVYSPAIQWNCLQARLSTLWSGRGGRILMTTPGSQLATLSAMWVVSFVSCRYMCFTIFCKHLLAQELIEEYEKKHGGDDKEAGGSKRKGGADGGEPKSKSAKKPDTRYWWLFTYMADGFLVIMVSWLSVLFSCFFDSLWWSFLRI